VHSCGVAAGGEDCSGCPTDRLWEADQWGSPWGCRHPHLGNATQEIN
jgi:hypothetical protein